ncbi:hypothetical protein GQ44DRAFT_670415 [Phaeosphaeriaceae sp. PMI808]|nr:hypothetical protein GQ44DRAFT_670415 [Phaeosphaeriaceae sp. PMI808]
MITKVAHTTHQISRYQLFNSTFWEVLPSHYDRIKRRWNLISCLSHEARFAPIATDRAAGTDSLKANLEMLKDDINTYRTFAKGINIRDIVELYQTAGRQEWSAERIAKEDFENLEKSLRLIEEKAIEIKDNILNGVPDAN